MDKKKSFAVKKLFPKYYKFQKNLIGKIPVKTKLWDQKKYNLNYETLKMLKAWKHKNLIKEADDVYQAYDGGDLIDVGAYNGFYSFLLSPKAKKGDSFISCEPDNEAQVVLLNNLSILKKIFNFNCYSLITKPISNGREVAISHDMFGHPCYTDTNNISDFERKKESTKSTSIDNLVMTLSLKPSFIKIDTEGSEFEVLEGMIETIKNFKPKIMLEKHPTMFPKNVSLEKIDNLLISNNYKANLINKSDVAIREIWD